MAESKWLESAPRVFVDVDVGDPAAFEAEVAAHERACAFLAAKGSTLGLASTPADLSADEAALALEAYALDPHFAAQGPANLVSPAPLRAGRLEIALNSRDCPRTAENFRCLCTGEKGKAKAAGKGGKEVQLCYRGSAIHRFEAGFFQGGDFTRGDGSGGESIYSGKRFKDEAKGLKAAVDRAGLVGMANSGKNSNSSQFFVTCEPCASLEGHHVIFGRVVAASEPEGHASGSGGAVGAGGAGGAGGDGGDGDGDGDGGGDGDAVARVLARIRRAGASGEPVVIADCGAL